MQFLPNLSNGEVVTKMNENTFIPIPGYEGLYCISQLGQVKHSKYSRVLHTTVTKRGYEVVVLSKNGIPTMYTVDSLVALAWEGKPIRKHKNVVRNKPIKCIETNETFNSYKECAQHMKFSYAQFRAAISKDQSFKGYHFERLSQ